MNKILSVLFVIFVGIFAVSCGSEDPKSIAVESMKTIYGGDAKGAMKFFDINEDDKSSSQMLEGKLMMATSEISKKTQAKGGISKIEAGESKIEENFAVVEVLITFKDDSTKTERVRLAKNKNGKWKIKL